MLALTIYVFLFLKRYEKRLKAAKLSEDKVDASSVQEKPTVLFKPSFKQIDPVDVY